MNKVTFIKVCQFLFNMSKAGIIACGITMTFVLAILSLARLQGVTSATADFSATISGWYSYLWICLIVIYAIGYLVLIGKWLKNKGG